MNKTTLLALAVATPALIALRPMADTIEFKPAEGASVTKTFTNTMNYSLDDMEVLMNGEENGMMPEIDMDMETVSTVRVTDTYGKVSDGRPESLVRSFDGIDMEFTMDMSAEGIGGALDNPTGHGSSPLEGKEVKFALDEASGDYKVEWADEDDSADEDLLENLVENMDVRGLLPQRELEVGGSYDIELITLIDLLAPGGDLKLDVEMDGMASPMGPTGDPQMMSNIRQMFGEKTEGDATGTLREVKEEDGSRIAIIALDIQIDTANDMTDMLRELMDEQMQEGMEMSLDRVDVQFALEASGELQWNLTKGVVHSLELEGDSAMAMEMEMAVDFGGQSMSIEMMMEMSGTLMSTIETE